MGVRSLTWAARRVDAETLDDARALAGALGLEVVADEPGKVVATTVRGDVVEWLAPERAEPAHLFVAQETVLGFDVDDLDAAMVSLAAAGFTPIVEPQRAPGDGIRFAHVRGPGGLVYGVIQLG
ncbi:VOC family protein [uncultured Microbacterium sp.]|uniref:VOC family protein n=1 Tax=uncultured Microbacterium sp. TaxID=191216 RepID=UPI00262A7EF9|nr:VOC family protein [uncultured Microbacterium sp.]